MSPRSNDDELRIARGADRGAQEEAAHALVQRIAEGDRAAFEELYELFARRVGGYLFKLLGRPELVEEALDDVMLVVWQKAATLRPDARVSTWIFGIAHRKALKALEGSRRHLRAVAPPEDLGRGAHAEASADPEQKTLRGDLLRRLARAIESLPPEQRAVVELAFFEGRSYAEISQVMDCPANTVKTRMFYARKHLRRALGGDLEAR